MIIITFRDIVAFAIMCITLIFCIIGIIIDYVKNKNIEKKERENKKDE